MLLFSSKYRLPQLVATGIFIFSFSPIAKCTTLAQAPGAAPFSCRIPAAVAYSAKEDTIRRIVVLPDYKGGMARFFQYILDYMQRRIPSYLIEGNLREMRFTHKVDTLGNVCDVKLLTPTGTELDKYLIEMLQHSPKWIPGTVNGKKEKMEMPLRLWQSR